MECEPDPPTFRVPRSAPRLTPYKIYHIDLPYVRGLPFAVVAVFEDRPGQLEWFLAIPDDARTFDGNRMGTAHAGIQPNQHELLNEAGLFEFGLYEARARVWAYERDQAAEQARSFKAPEMKEDNKNFFVSYWFSGKCLDHIRRIARSTLLPILREDLQLVETLPGLQRRGL